MAAIKALEQWCRFHCEGYRDVSITNMTTSFRSGLAFCALIHKYRPDLLDYDSLRKEDVFENNRLAFQVAEEKLGIPALLDAEDMVALRIPDRLSILTYVSQYYNYFKGRPPMGGAKRSAEGCREEPSERKPPPVVAQTFVSKTATESRLPSKVAARTSPEVARAAAQAAVPAENANTNGSLGSRCVACRGHVHLVQRHFVEGKLYHRSCFRCSECSSVLHAGGYRPGESADAFLCDGHQGGCAVGAAGRPAPRRSSVLTTPPVVPAVGPPSPAPPPESWTASAQRTQSARRRFLQAPPQVAEAWASSWKLAEPSGASGRPKVPRSPDGERSDAKATVGRKLAEENRNNNNKRPFTIRSAETRFGDGPSLAIIARSREPECGRGPAGSWAGQSSARQTDRRDSPRLEDVGKDDARPATGRTTAKDPVHEGRSKLVPRPELGPTGADETFTAPRKPGSVSTTSSDVSISATSSPPAPTPAAPPVDPSCDPERLRDVPPQEPRPGPGSQDFRRGGRPPVAPPARRPAVEPASGPVTSPTDQGHPSGAKKGKYLSPANVPATKMRSPSVKPYHVPLEQIEGELCDIERSLARLERDGVELEKRLRSCEEEGEGDILMDPLMVDWFNLIRKKQVYIRKESELVYIARTQELEQQQPGVEGELRRLLEKPDHLKSREERWREERLMQRLMEIVDGRNAIVEVLDEDRLREVEEDQQLNEMMKNLGVKKAKTKRKSSISKLFRRRSKRRVE